MFPVSSGERKAGSPAESDGERVEACAVGGGMERLLWG